jgi:hypothetical protein
VQRPTKITLAEMRASGVRGTLAYCSDYQCSHWVRLDAATCDRWSDDIRLSDLEPRFVCAACGTRGADMRPDFDWEKAKARGADDKKAGACCVNATGRCICAAQEKRPQSASGSARKYSRNRQWPDCPSPRTDQNAARAGD